MFRSISANNSNKEIPHLNWKYLEFSFSNSLEQIITRPNRVTGQTATLCDYILKNSPFLHSCIFCISNIFHVKVTGKTFFFM